MKSKGVLYKPYVDLKIADDSFVKLYLDSSDYNRIKVFKRQTLLEERKKVVVKALTREISKGETPFLYCVKLVGFDIVSGETLPGKSEVPIDDYN
ncbi:hypothetical protein WBG78_30455 [Chryseolinea sp. T2]|uniref:hypothetical protein n=1 Tax=Chryseolinea sp. T2 TaxID=3129255 RepID=UPI0030788D5D